MRIARLAPAATLGLLLIAAGTSARAESPEELVERGNSAYEAGDYAGAAEAYRTALRYGVRDPIVEYNLGNAEFRLGSLGQAILRYERARRLAPADPDVRANLSFARSQCLDRVEIAPPPTVVRSIVLAQDRLGPDRQAWAVLATLWLAGAVLVAGLWRPGGWRPLHGWLLAGLLAVAALVFASWSVTVERVERTHLAVVIDDLVEVLAGPGENNPTLFTVHEGLTLEVRAEREEWLQVSLPNGLNGWVHRSAIATV